MDRMFGRINSLKLYSLLNKRIISVDGNNKGTIAGAENLEIAISRIKALRIAKKFYNFQNSVNISN